MSLAQLSTILVVGCRPLSADFGAGRFIQLFLYVHRVDGLSPGVYKFLPEFGGLEQARQGDQRLM